MVVSEKTKEKILKLIEGWDHHNHRAAVFHRGAPYMTEDLVEKIAAVVDRDQAQEVIDSLGDGLATNHQKLAGALEASAKGTEASKA